MATSSKAPAASTPSPTAIRRLSRDLQKMKEEPIDGIDAMPLEENILEWHYVIRGSKGTAFEGGLYHGKLVFPCEFPWKPPSIYMFTPNGRFLPNQRLCLSISDYHPETWNPGWTVSAILVGLHSFMNESSIATGTETTTAERKKELAGKSASYNLRDATFCKLFPALVAEIQAKGVARMSDAQAQEETNRSVPRYARGPMPNDPDFMQNARQHMMNMQNEMEAAMRAAMRDAAMPNFPPRPPLLPDDVFFGVRAGPGMVLQQGQQMPLLQQQHQMGGAAAHQHGVAAAVAAAAPDFFAAVPNLLEEMNGDGRAVAAARPPAVAVIQGFPQHMQLRQQQQGQAPPVAAAAAAGPLRRAADEDAGPPPKRTPDVVTLD